MAALISSGNLFIRTHFYEKKMNKLITKTRNNLKNVLKICYNKFITCWNKTAFNRKLTFNRPLYQCVYKLYDLKVSKIT